MFPSSHHGQLCVSDRSENCSGPRALKKFGRGVEWAWSVASLFDRKCGSGAITGTATGYLVICFVGVSVRRDLGAI
jgi:hypothetical protein